jgi:hypothetical protein
MVVVCSETSVYFHQTTQLHNPIDIIRKPLTSGKNIKFAICYTSSWLKLFLILYIYIIYIYLNPTCLIKQLAPNYARIKVPNTSTASKYTQHKISKIRIKDIINKFVSDSIIYILSYIQHNGDVSLENWTPLVYTKEVGPQS